MAYPTPPFHSLAFMLSLRPLGPLARPPRARPRRATTTRSAVRGGARWRTPPASTFDYLVVCRVSDPQRSPVGRPPSNRRSRPVPAGLGPLQPSSDSQVTFCLGSAHVAFSPAAPGGPFARLGPVLAHAGCRTGPLPREAFPRSRAWNNSAMQGRDGSCRGSRRPAHRSRAGALAATSFQTPRARPPQALLGERGAVECGEGCGFCGPADSEASTARGSESSASTDLADGCGCASPRGATARAAPSHGTGSNMPMSGFTDDRGISRSGAPRGCPMHPCLICAGHPGWVRLSCLGAPPSTLTSTLSPSRSRRPEDVRATRRRAQGRRGQDRHGHSTGQHLGQLPRFQEALHAEGRREYHLPVVARVGVL